MKTLLISIFMLVSFNLMAGDYFTYDQKRQNVAKVVCLNGYLFALFSGSFPDGGGVNIIQIWETKDKPAKCKKS